MERVCYGNTRTCDGAVVWPSMTTNHRIDNYAHGTSLGPERQDPVPGQKETEGKAQPVSQCGLKD